MTVFSDILISKVSEEVLPDWTIRTLKVEKVSELKRFKHTLKHVCTIFVRTHIVHTSCMCEYCKVKHQKNRQKQLYYLYLY